MSLSVVPVTPEREGDLLGLFGSNGAYSNCWCTWWILTNRDFVAASPAERREILLDRIGDEDPPGLLAYRSGIAVGWCAVGPRSSYARMMSQRSRVFRPVDDDPDQWVINCLYVDSEHRGTGVARTLLGVAIEHAFALGASRIEAYPVDTAERSPRPADLFTGTLDMFIDAGFVEVGRPNRRPLVRMDRPI